MYSIQYGCQIKPAHLYHTSTLIHKVMKITKNADMTMTMTGLMSTHTHYTLRHTHKDNQTHTATHLQTDTCTHTPTDRHMDTHTDRQTHAHTQPYDRWQTSCRPLDPPACYFEMTMKYYTSFESTIFVLKCFENGWILSTKKYLNIHELTLSKYLWTCPYVSGWGGPNKIYRQIIGACARLLDLEVLDFGLFWNFFYPDMPEP